MGVAGISIDPPSSNAGMVEKLDTPFPLLSDPEGAFIERLGLWNEQEGVSEPAIVLVDRSGTACYVYSGGTDFADRPLHAALTAEIDRLPEAAPRESPEELEFRVSAEEAERATLRPDRPPMELEDLRPYYLGTYFAVLSTKKKVADAGMEESDLGRKVEGHFELSEEYSVAVRETLKSKRG